METFLRLLFLTGLIALGASMPYGIPPLDPTLNELWTEFKNSFNKEYISDETEILRRYIWEKNFQRINKHNFESSLGQHSFWLGINEYSDMMDHEFKQVMNGFGLSYSDYSRYNSTLRFMDEDVSNLPKKVDWRKEGYVTEVKNQGNCGSCWAFSTTGSLEGQYFKKTGKLVSLSEQDLVDCAGPCGNNGCEGGTMDGAFTCIAKEGGIDSESNYPYIAKDSTCRFNRNESVTTLKNYVDIKQFSEKALQKAVAIIGPISVAIDASDFAFSQYRSGIYENSLCSPFRLDHGVLVVGYGTDHGKDYWLVKNSWGPSWGLNGYIKMARNENNMCGIATMASYPVL